MRPGEDASPMTNASGGRESASSTYDGALFSDLQLKKIAELIDERLDEFNDKISGALDSARKSAKDINRKPVGQADIDLHLRAEERFKENQGLDSKQPKMVIKRVEVDRFTQEFSEERKNPKKSIDAHDDIGSVRKYVNQLKFQQKDLKNAYL